MRLPWPAIGSALPSFLSSTVPSSEILRASATSSGVSTFAANAAGWAAAGCSKMPKRNIGRRMREHHVVEPRLRHLA